jgi:hypothetical protein
MAALYTDSINEVSDKWPIVYYNVSWDLESCLGGSTMIAVNRLFIGSFNYLVIQHFSILGGTAIMLAIIIGYRGLCDSLAFFFSLSLTLCGWNRNKRCFTHITKILEIIISSENILSSEVLWHEFFFKDFTFIKFVKQCDCLELGFFSGKTLTD